MNVEGSFPLGACEVQRTWGINGIVGEDLVTLAAAWVDVFCDWNGPAHAAARIGHTVACSIWADCRTEHNADLVFSSLLSALAVLLALLPLALLCIPCLVFLLPAYLAAICHLSPMQRSSSPPTPSTLWEPHMRSISDEVAHVSTPCQCSRIQCPSSGHATLTERGRICSSGHAIICGTGISTQLCGEVRNYNGEGSRMLTAE